MSWADMDAPRLLSAPAVGRALGVSDQTVRNWHGRGCPADGADAWGRPLFVLAKVREWKKRNLPETGRGGVRSRAGRRKKALTAAGNAAPLVVAAEAEREADEALKKRVVAARQRIQAGDGTPDDVALVNESGGGVQMEDRALEEKALKNRKERLEQAVRAGELLEAGDVRRQVSALLTRVCELVNTIPVRVAPVLGTAAGLDTRGVLLVREKLSAELARVVGDLLNEYGGNGQASESRSAAA